MACSWVAGRSVAARHATGVAGRSPRRWPPVHGVPDRGDTPVGRWSRAARAERRTVGGVRRRARRRVRRGSATACSVARCALGSGRAALAARARARPWPVAVRAWVVTSPRPPGLGIGQLRPRLRQGGIGGVGLVAGREVLVHPLRDRRRGGPVAGEALGSHSPGGGPRCRPSTCRGRRRFSAQGLPVVELRRRALADVVDQHPLVVDDVEVVDPHLEAEVDVLAAGDQVLLAPAADGLDDVGRA